jgi:hypothetical protein
MRSGIEPGKTSAQLLHLERLLFKVLWFTVVISSSPRAEGFIFLAISTTLLG